MSNSSIIYGTSVTSFGGINNPDTGRNLTGSFHLMRFKYIGGLVRQLCVDMGGHQGSEGSAFLNNQVEVIPEVVVITHAHMDHIGRLPVLWLLWKKEGISGKIYMGQLTKLVVLQALLDAANILTKQYGVQKGNYDYDISELKEALRVKTENLPKSKKKQTKEAKNQDSSGNNMVTTKTAARSSSSAILEQSGSDFSMSLSEATAFLSQERFMISSQKEIDLWIEANRPVLAFKKSDVIEMMGEVSILPEGAFTEVLPGVSVRPYCAGHILGSKSMLFAIRKGENKEVYAYFSGDLGSYRWPTKPAGEIEVPGKEFPLVFAMMESTYGGTVREDFHRGMATLERDLEHAAKKKIASVFACFSLDRAQRVLHELLLLSKKNGWTFPIYMDSPLSVKYTTLYGEHAEDPEFRASMKKVVVIKDENMRKAMFSEEKNFRVIITSSGMADAGPVLHYLNAWISNPSVEFSFPGYMAENSQGWKLAVKRLKLIPLTKEERAEDGEMQSTIRNVLVQAKVNHYTHFSGHADEKDLLRWHTSLPKARGMKTSIVHGVREGSSQALWNTMKRRKINMDHVGIPELEEEVVLF